MIKNKSHNFHQSIIREYDIRGIYGETLFDIDAEILGNLFGKIIGKNNTINIGHDGRLSSISLKKLISGLLECGVHVNEIGLCPTPLLYFSVSNFLLKEDYCNRLSQSKNHNGFKIVLENMLFFRKRFIRNK